MPRQVKVYGWIGFRSEAYTDGNHHGQTREVVAAKSAAEVMRITGMTRSEWTHSGCETGNQEEIDLALTSPGTVFWQPLSYNVTDRGWQAATRG